MKSGFTLAEILITVGIIGVIAAITVVNIIENFQKTQTSVRLKSAYSILSNALKMAESEHNDISDWNFNLSGIDFYNNYLARYLKDTKNFNDKIRPDGYKDYLLNGQLHVSGHGLDTASAKIILANGTYMIISKFYNVQNVVFDINAFKGPNIIGKDIFYFEITTKGLNPYGFISSIAHIPENYSRATLMSENMEYACNKKRAGVWCSALIMFDGWRIKPDYPW